MKITATEPSSALRNAVEIEQVLTQQYRGKENIPPILRIYTDGGPEHRTNFMSVKLAIIALHQSINTDLNIALRSAPGHSFKNPAERVNCILNFGLYSMGVMRNMYHMPDFEKKLHQCSNLTDVCKLLHKDHENINLLKESYQPTITLIKDIWSFKTKRKLYYTLQCCRGQKSRLIFQLSKLDINISPNETAKEQ